MPVRIENVEKGSIACKKGICSGDILESINGNEINDVLDYQFYITDEKLDIVYSRGGRERHVRIKKPEYEDIGLIFSTYLMDEQHTCRNKCIFCFIDQMPPGMRKSLYVKDDDERMSFLFGNYITLTNLRETDVQRIIKMHISPINISVHTMNPELRVRMMKNRFAGDCLIYIDMFAAAGIKMNCQLVLCPGINDGEELVYSIKKLASLYPAVQSIAAVPVGLTSYRDGLEKIEPYNNRTAKGVLDIINSFGDKFEKECGTRLIYPADEFYVICGLDTPGYEYYGDFLQLENGVGMCTLLRYDFLEALKTAPEKIKGGKISIATGEASYKIIKRLVDMARDKWHNLECKVYKIDNDFFGRSISVTGLICGQDLIKQLSGVDLGEYLLISDSMLDSENARFLDDVTPSEVEEALKIRLRAVPCNGGYELLSALIGAEL